jgi:predicted AAA+ superfamily ATPase
MVVIATGSSSFELAQQIGEPLTGRKISAILFPLSQKELAHHYNRHELKDKLEEFLVYGSYPEVLTADNRREKIRILQELVDSYLLKDILSHDRIKSPRKLLQLLKLLAFQMGSEVSLNEIATKLRIDVKTVARYLDLLEKTFVIKRLGGFRRNLRKEVTAKAKYCFWDNGVRNAIISQMNPLEDRNDHGALFENFVLMKRIKNTYIRRLLRELLFLEDL